jgi:hypothetical protein
VNRIRNIGRRIALLTGLATALLTATGTVPAFAREVPPPDVGCGSCAPAVGGMPGWQVALIVVAAVAAVTIVAVALIHRARVARRQVGTPQRQAVSGK